MTIVNKPIDMVAQFNTKGEVNPIRFRMLNEDESETVIKIDKVILKDKEKVGKDELYIFKCRSIIDGINKSYEIKYQLNTCKWVLFKI